MTGGRDAFRPREISRRGERSGVNEGDYLERERSRPSQGGFRGAPSVSLLIVEP